jgi:hypothetical protein
MVAIGWPVKTVQRSGCLFAWYPEKNCGIIMNYSPEQHADAGVHQRETRPSHTGMIDLPRHPVI